MPHARIVVIGASAGGFEVVRTVLGGLPADLPAAVLVVIHTGPSGIYPGALARGSRLPVGIARDGEPLEDGRVYVAPPDRHLTVLDGVARVGRGPSEHGFRPAIDPLFTTAAAAAGPRAAGVILSGALSDGTLGLHAIKQAGGLAVVQDPEDAPFPSMPMSALRSVAIDAVLPASQIGRHLMEWAMDGAKPRAATKKQEAHLGGKARWADPSPQLLAVTCPSCGGSISEVELEGLTHYECHVGHRFDAESLIALGDERTEKTLWKAVRALQEQALLRQRMVQRARDRGLTKLASTWRRDAVDAEKRAREICGLIEGVPVAREERLAAVGDRREAREDSRGARGGRRRTRQPLGVTREQARLAAAMHRASRGEKAPGAKRRRTSGRRR